MQFEFLTRYLFPQLYQAIKIILFYTLRPSIFVYVVSYHSNWRLFTKRGLDPCIFPFICTNEIVLFQVKEPFEWYE